MGVNSIEPEDIFGDWGIYISFLFSLLLFFARFLLLVLLFGFGWLAWFVLKRVFSLALPT